jgi:hypothetical protein
MCVYQAQLKRVNFRFSYSPNNKPIMFYVEKVELISISNCDILEMFFVFVFVVVWKACYTFDGAVVVVSSNF